MTIVKCAVCQKAFYSKPSQLKLGWGKYCSATCRNKSQFNGHKVRCFTCGKGVYKSLARLKHSKSGNYFCDKKCQTLWRNSIFSGEKSPNWINGIRSYREILLRNEEKPVCVLCRVADVRILTVHHVDGNRKNNLISNLVWVCHNCHHLVHRYNGYETKINKMVTVA